MSAPATALNSSSTDAPAQPAPGPRRIRIWFRTHVVRPLKQSHWVFQIGDFLRLLMTRQQQTDELIRQWGQQQVTLATIAKDLDERLNFHETGPLQVSAVRLHKLRTAREQRRKARANGGHVDGPRSQPTKTIDAAGNVVDIAPLPENPPPGEAAGGFEDDER